MIKTAIWWANGMVIVFDEKGNQLPEYQGKIGDVRDKILADAPADAVLCVGDWQTGETARVNRQIWRIT